VTLRPIASAFLPFFRPVRPIRARQSRELCSEEGISVEVVGQIGHADFEASSSDSYAAESVSSKVSDAPEDVFGAAPYRAFDAVPLGLFAGQLAGAGAFFADEVVDPVPGEVSFHGLADVGAVRPQSRAAVVFSDQLADGLRVVDGGVGDRECLHELAYRIDLRVVLIAVVGLAVLLGPARIAVFLTAAPGVLLEAFGTPTLFDLTVLTLRFCRRPAPRNMGTIALARGLHKARIDDLSFLSDQSPGPELAVESLENRTDSFFAQTLLESPDRGMVGNRIARTQPHEPQEAEAVGELELHLFIAQIVESLQKQHLQHQHRTPGRTSSSALVLVGQMLQQHRTKPFPVDDREPIQARFSAGHPIRVAENVEEIALLASCFYTHVSTSTLHTSEKRGKSKLPEIPPH